MSTVLTKVRCTAPLNSNKKGKILNRLFYFTHIFIGDHITIYNRTSLLLL